MKLFLIRHGDTAWTLAGRYQGITDLALSSEGIRQAKRVGRALQPERPTRIYTSGLQRARETACLVARPLGLEPVVDPRLNEIDFGKWEGASFDDLADEGDARFRRWREGKLKAPPGGESLDSLARRIGQFLKEILNRHPGDSVAVVSHGGPIKMFLFKALSAPLSSIWSFRVDPGSISLIEGNRRLLQIVWTNHTPSLNSHSRS